jgi:predicted amidophosphoribosyltransferase
VLPKYRDILSGKPVILVDDVMASGAALSAATRCLLAAGSGPIKGILVARVL